MQPFGNGQQYSSRQETKYGTESLIDPILINSILHKETYTDDEYKDTDLSEEILTDELLIVHLFLLFRNSLNTNIFQFCFILSFYFRCSLFFVGKICEQ